MSEQKKQPSGCLIVFLIVIALVIGIQGCSSLLYKGEGGKCRYCHQQTSYRYTSDGWVCATDARIYDKIGK